MVETLSGGERWSWKGEGSEAADRDRMRHVRVELARISHYVIVI